MAKLLSPVCNEQQFDNDGNMLAGGTITVYTAGTLTIATIYANSDGGALSNPVTLNSSGRIPNGQIFLDASASYDFVVRDGSTVIESFSNIIGVGAGSGGGDGFVTSSALASSTGSSLVGYNSGVTNAVTRTVQAKESDVLSVKDFGAKGDSITDDTNAINNALIAGAGKTVFFPAGTYVISNQIQIKSQTTLLGSGEAKSVIKLASSFPANITAVHNATTSGTINTYYDRQISVNGLTFDGNNNATRTSAFFMFAKVDACEIVGCEFINHSYICVTVLGSRDVNIHHNKFQGNGYPKPSTVSTPCVHTDNNDILGIPYNVNIEHNTFIDNNWSCAYFMPHGGSFSYNYCQNNGESGVFTNQNGTNLRYIGNQIYGQGRSNISASGIETGGINLSIVANNIQNCGADGISLTDTQNVVVSDNVILNNGQEVAYFAGAAGIQLITYGSTQPDHIRITQNRIGDIQTTKTQNSGIRVNGPGAGVLHVAIHDNDLTSQKTVDFDINSSKWDTATCYTMHNYLIDGSIDTSSGGTVSGIAGGSSNQVLFQSAPNTTSFISAPSGNVVTTGGYLSYNGTSFGWSNTLKAVTYATSDGTSTGSNAYFGENSAYGTIGGVNGVVIASGASYPGTGRYVGDSISWRPFADNAYSLGTSSQRWTTTYSNDLDLSGSVTSGTWAGATISPAKGGTGSTSVPTNGQLLIGNGSTYTASTLTAGAGVTITNGAGSITISSTGGGGSSIANNLAGGGANQIPVQTAVDTTSFIAAPSGSTATTGGSLIYNGTSIGWSNALKAVTYATSDGTSTGSNAYFGEDAAYATIGGTNGLVIATGGTYPGTGKYVGDVNAWRPFTTGSQSLGTSSQRWTTTYSNNLDLSGSVTSGTWAGTAIDVTKGGTGITTTPTNGQVLIGNGTGYTKTTLTAGAGVTITNGAGSITIAASGGSGTVTSVNASGGTTGLSFSGGPITSSGTLTMAGTLAVANGGTGSTSLAGAGIVTTTGSQTISGAKSFTALTNAYTGTTYSTSNGSTSNAYFGENSTYAVIGGVLGTVFATGASYPGTSTYVAATDAFRPAVDNSKSLGLSSNRWTTVYAVTGTINTSDRNEKDCIEVIDEVEKLVAIRVSKMFKKFKWKASIAEKGIDGARIHFGTIAQDVRDAFAAEGLDANQYGMFCSDTWTDDDGIEHTRLGVRYEELLCFLMANMFA